MKGLVLLIILGEAFASQESIGRAIPSACLVGKKVGPCKGKFTRFYFNEDTKQCEEFTYGGCQGNSNNFMTLKECQAVCKEFDKRECLKEPVEGRCSGAFPMYFYDHESRSCKSFDYTGCGGNDNRFSTEIECLDNCGYFVNHTECEQKPDKGVCLDNLPRYYYDQNTTTCRKFTYSGCLGNNNRFVKRTDCEDICGKIPRRPDECLLEKDEGRYSSYDESRWYFENETGKCQKFTRYGFGGNANNFKTEEECKAICE